MITKQAGGIRTKTNRESIKMPPKRGKAKGAKTASSRIRKQQPPTPIILSPPAPISPQFQLPKSPLQELVRERGHPAISFRDALGNYHDQIILKYYLTTTKGKKIKKNFIEHGHLHGVEDWIEPGYVCTDFETEIGPGGIASSISTRWFVEVPRNAEIVHEMVGEHGIVCIHSAISSVPSSIDVVSDLWLVSIQNSAGQTVWPMTWIYNDDFDGLVRHATSAESENWRNTRPWELNLIPQTLADAPPLIRIVGITRANKNVPFRFYMTCQIRTENQGFVTETWSPPDLVEMLSCLYMQMRQFKIGNWHNVQWKSLEIKSYLPEDPLLLPHINPIYWKLEVLPKTAQMENVALLQKQYLLPEEYQDTDEYETSRRDEIWRKVFYSDDIDYENVSVNSNPVPVGILM